MTTQPDPESQANIQGLPTRITYVDDAVMPPRARRVAYWVVIVAILVLGVLGWIFDNHWLYIAGLVVGLLGAVLAVLNPPYRVLVRGQVFLVHKDGTEEPITSV